MKSNSILMIDDDQDTLMLYKLSLKDTEFSSNFFTFDNAREALDYLHASLDGQHPIPSYIIIDLNMPDMSGFQFITFFEDKFYHQMPDTKIITTTSSIREKDREEAIQYRCVIDFVSKPISKPHLIELFEA